MKKRNVIILLVLTIIILYFTLKDNFFEILNALLNINIIWLIISYLLVLSYTFFKSLVTHDILNKLKKNKFKKIFTIQMITFFFNAITPFSAGGQPFQVYMFNKAGNTLVDSTNTVVQESMIHQISLLLVVVISLILNNFFNIYKIDNFLLIFLIIGFLANVFTVSLLFVISNAKKLDKIIVNFIINIVNVFKKINKQETKEKIYESLEKFNENSKILLKNKFRFIRLILTNSAALVCLYLVPLTLTFSLNNFYAFDAITSIVLVTFTSIMSSFIPLPGGIVGQEYVFTVLFSAYLIDPFLGTLMILWRFITYYLPLTIGAIILNIKQKDFFRKNF